MKRLSFRELSERPKTTTTYAELPKFKDILLSFDVKTQKEVNRDLRLVGNAIEFIEYSNKKRLPGQEQPVSVPFVDAELSNKPTRYGKAGPDGKPDPDDPWFQMGYSWSRKFAINCLEKQDDGTWVPKVLMKGPSVFNHFLNWTKGQFLYKKKADADEEVITFLGGDVAPIVTVTAEYAPGKLGNIEYSVYINGRNKMTEDMINLLREVREPSAEELSAARDEYNAEMEDGDHPWRDYFMYGYDIERMFKPTPPKAESESYETESVEDDFKSVQVPVKEAFNDSDEDSNSELVATAEEADELAELDW